MYRFLSITMRMIRRKATELIIDKDGLEKEHLRIESAGERS